MGEKKELRNELALVTQQFDAAQRDNYELRSRLAELQSMPALGDGSGGDVQLATDQHDPTTRAQIAKALGIVPRPGQPATEEDILRAVERLRGAPAGGSEEGGHVALVKGETLAHAVNHNKAERQQLLDSLTDERTVLQSVSATLGVTQGGAAGRAELVERAQRFATFQHLLRTRLQAAEASAGVAPPAPIADASALDKLAAGRRSELDAAAVRDELRAIIAMLVAEPQLAKFLAGKPLKVSKTVLDLASSPTPVQTGQGYLDTPFSMADLTTLAMPLKGAMTTVRRDQLTDLLCALAGARTVGADLVDFMNAIVLPMLRQIWTSTTPRERPVR